MASEYQMSRGWSSEEEPELVEMCHPDAEESIFVSERAVHVHEDNGWSRKNAEEAETDSEPESGASAEPREPAEQEEEEE